MKNEEVIIVIIAVILGLFILGTGFGGMMGYGYGMMPSFSGMWLFGWLFMILLLIALILLIVWLTKQIQGGKK